MYYICYDVPGGDGIYETVYGTDAMQQRVDEIVTTFGLNANEVHVFDADDEL